ncbi:hypothetical protein [Nostoc sp.]|uniref:hypothetical protein n=1 Tax=Nostoc sp. TaxID=1180 RepID=UPI002FF8A453
MKTIFSTTKDSLLEKGVTHEKAGRKSRDHHWIEPWDRQSDRDETIGIIFDF